MYNKCLPFDGNPTIGHSFVDVNYLVRMITLVNGFFSNAYVFNSAHMCSPRCFGYFNLLNIGVIPTFIVSFSNSHLEIDKFSWLKLNQYRNH